MGREDITNSFQVYTTQDDKKKIKNNPQVYTTQEVKGEIKSSPRVSTTGASPANHRQNNTVVVCRYNSELTCLHVSVMAHSDHSRRSVYGIWNKG